MRKLKFQGGLTKLITSKLGDKNKKRFAEYIAHNLIALRKNVVSEPIAIDVVSFSSKKDLCDQVLSILSFLRYAGEPLSWTLYSDGSHTREQIAHLEQSFSFLKVQQYDWDQASDIPCTLKETLIPYRSELFDYAKTKPLGKKAFYFLNHAIKHPTLFLDADILFYKKASVFKLILKEKVNGWFLPDPSWGCLDTRYKQQHSEELYQLNGGFVLMNHEPAHLSEALGFLKSLNYTYEYFTDQTIFHILSRYNNFMPLDPRTFILNSADQFDFSYLHPREKMAIRHYSGPVRHKMWQKDWKWQLSLS